MYTSCTRTDITNKGLLGETKEYRDSRLLDDVRRRPELDKLISYCVSVQEWKPSVPVRWALRLAKAALIYR